MSEFADDDFEEEDYPEEEEEVEEGPPKKIAPQKKPVKKVRAREEARPTDRYSLFAVPTRIGVFDNVENKPIMEAPDEQSLNAAILAKILNELAEIKESI